MRFRLYFDMYVGNNAAGAQASLANVTCAQWDFEYNGVSFFTADVAGGSQLCEEGRVTMMHNLNSAASGGDDGSDSSAAAGTVAAIIIGVLVIMFLVILAIVVVRNRSRTRRLSFGKQAVGADYELDHVTPHSMNPTYQSASDPTYTYGPVSEYLESSCDVSEKVVEEDFEHSVEVDFPHMPPRASLSVADPDTGTYELPHSSVRGKDIADYCAATSDDTVHYSTAAGAPGMFDAAVAYAVASGDSHGDYDLVDGGADGLDEDDEEDPVYFLGAAANDDYENCSSVAEYYTPADDDVSNGTTSSPDSHLETHYDIGAADEATYVDPDANYDIGAADEANYDVAGSTNSSDEDDIKHGPNAGMLDADEDDV